MQQKPEKRIIEKEVASLKRLEIGGVLSIDELLKTASLLEVAKRAKSYSRSDRELWTLYRINKNLATKAGKTYNRKRGALLFGLQTVMSLVFWKLNRNGPWYCNVFQEGGYEATGEDGR